MTTIKRPANPKEQRMGFVRTIVIVFAIGLFVFILFQNDPFSKKQHGDGNKKDHNMMTATSEVVNNNNHNHNSTIDDHKGTGDTPLLRSKTTTTKTTTIKSNEHPIEPNSRIYIFELENLVNNGAADDGGGTTTGDDEAATKTSSSGTIMIRTRPSWAPIGVEHFHQLMDRQYYKGCKFFRVLPNFVVQFGIAANPNHPMNQDAFIRTPIVDDPVQQTNSRGTVTFATSGPNTRTTQLFINTNRGGNAFLDKQGFAPIAEVIEDGMDLVDLIYNQYREKPDQGKIQKQGNDYLDHEFPLLSYIKDTRSI